MTNNQIKTFFSTPQKEILIGDKTANEIKKMFSAMGKEGEAFLNSPLVEEAAKKSLRPGKDRERWMLAIDAEIKGKRKNMMFRICPFFLGGFITKSIQICKELSPAEARRYAQDLLPIVIKQGKYVKRNTKNVVPHLTELQTWLSCVVEPSSFVVLNEILKGLTEQVGGKMLKLAVDGLGDHFSFETINTPEYYPGEKASQTLTLLTELAQQYGDNKNRNMEQQIFMGGMVHLIPKIMGGRGKKPLSAPFVNLIGHILAKQNLKEMTDDALLSVIQPESYSILKTLVAEQGIENYLTRLNQWAIAQEDWRKKENIADNSENKAVTHMIDKTILFLFEQPEYQSFEWNMNHYHHIQKVIKMSNKVIKLYQVKRSLPIAPNHPKPKV